MNRGSVLATVGATSGESAAAQRVRHDWLDALKGVGIVAVVAGHVWSRGWPHHILYSFHMPLFFMITGAVTRVAPLRVLLPRLLRSLGLPFFSFGLLLLFGDFFIEGLRHGGPIFPDPVTGLRAMLLQTQSLRGPFAILWFVPCLFIARLIWNALLEAFRPSSLAMLMIMAVTLLIAIAADRWGGASPFGLLAVPAALLMVWVGAIWRDWHKGSVAGWAIAAFAVVALIVFPSLNMRAGDIGWPLLSLAGAAAIVDRLAWGLRLLPDRIMQPLAALGRNSLAIMFLHNVFVHYLAPYAGRFALFLVALTGSLILALLMRRNRILALLFLGRG